MAVGLEPAGGFQHGRMFHARGYKIQAFGGSFHRSADGHIVAFRPAAGENDFRFVRSEEIGDDVGEIDATVEGDDSKIAFNGRYLTDVLSVLKESQVALETTSPSSPGLIRPVGSDNYTHVVMPMFVQW